MNLYFLRHGIAVPSDDASGAKADSERSLTPKGVKRTRKASRGLRRLGIPFDAILSSPLVRARQTAEIVADTLNLGTLLKEISALAPESSVDHLILTLERFNDRKHLLLVGHQPLLGQTAVSLLSGKNTHPIHIELRKGGICRVEIDTLPPTEPGTLHWLLGPKQLRLIGERAGKA
jgi:phosphohistidine phosphatase